MNRTEAAREEERTTSRAVEAEPALLPSQGPGAVVDLRTSLPRGGTTYLCVVDGDADGSDEPVAISVPLFH